MSMVSDDHPSTLKNSSNITRAQRMANPKWESILDFTHWKSVSIKIKKDRIFICSSLSK